MKKLLLLIALLGTQSAVAKPLSDVKIGEPACYGREYSSNHMATHILQTVQKITLKFSKDEYSSDDGLLLNIDAMIKKSGEMVKFDGGKQKYQMQLKHYVSGMYCQKSGKTSMNCTIDCDGGSAEVKWDVKTSGNEILFVNKGFQLYGGCGEDEDDSANWIWLDPKKGGDSTFKLYALPKEYCQE